MKYLLIFLFIGTVFLSCRPEEEILAGEAINLRFEADTVAFDTLFTTERSITKRLRVYNPSRKTVIIEYIGLEKGAESPFQVYVNGIAGKEFGEQQLIGGDSLLLLFEARLPETDDTLPYLAQDLLVLNNRGFRQEIPVIGYGQNAQFVSDSVVVCDQVWDSPIPYVFSKSVLVDTLCTLTISKGSKLYFKKGATLYVKGSLVAEGDTAANDRILFRSHRVGPAYDQQPGQWGGLIFMPGAHGNRLSYCTIRNAHYGIYLDAPDEDEQPELELNSCRIENNLWGGIVAINSRLIATNTLVHSSARYTVANLGGGHYSYTHCTFVNFFSQREAVPAFYISDENPLKEVETPETAPLTVKLINSIVWGNRYNGIEIKLDAENQENVQLETARNLLRTTDSFWNVNDNITARDIYFPNFRANFPYDYTPDSLSPAVDAAIQLEIEYDLNGTVRDQNPDIGAFEFVPLPDSEKGSE